MPAQRSRAKTLCVSLQRGAGPVHPANTEEAFASSGAQSAESYERGVAGSLPPL